MKKMGIPTFLISFQIKIIGLLGHRKCLWMRKIREKAEE
jgi:hypothetical protein